MRSRNQKNQHSQQSDNYIAKSYRMEYIEQVINLYKHDQFFEFHGLTLSFLWCVAVTLAIIVKRWNVYLHAITFFVIDVTTIYFVAGAWTRIYPHIDQWDQWPLLKKGHIVGGTIVAVLLVLQHFLGVKAILTDKYSPIHRKLGWLVTNLARVVAYFGWVFGHYANKEQMALNVLIGTVVLFVLSTMKVLGPQPAKPEVTIAPKRD